MAKSARASSVKKNNQRLKKHVFGPIETARNERLSTKLLELASQPKPPKSEMEVEQNAADNAQTEKSHNGVNEADRDVDMDIDEATTRQKNASKRQRRPSSPRVEKKKHRRARNSIVFPMRHLKSKKGKKS